MSEMCPVCGLPHELCVCEGIAKSEQRIKVYAVKRKFNKLITIVEGIDAKNIDIWEVAKKLKSKFACGGTVKENLIELQGDHKSKVKAEMIKLGFSEETIEVV